MSAKEPLLDDDVLRELREMLGAGLDPVLSSFGNQAREVLGAMETALTAGDADTLRKLAHTLKGSAGSVGAKALGTQVARVEKLASGGNMTAAAFQMELLPALVSKTVHALRQLGVQRGA
jgi:HPt (histidine-containing phosphotransfer) domain-containing protein